MQTKLSIAVSTLALIAALSGGAMASDLGGLKDGAAYDGGDGRPVLWTGWAITGSIGWAQQNMDIKRSITRDAQTGLITEKGEDGITEGDTKVAAHCAKDGVKTTDNLGPNGDCDNNGVSGDTLVPTVLHGPEAAEDDTLPFNVTNWFSQVVGAESFETDGLQGGVELSRRQQMGGWVLEGAIGANFDGSSKASASHDTLFEISRVNEDGTLDDPAFEGTGVAEHSVEKKRDFYGVVRAGRLVTDRLLLGVGGGVVYGMFDVKSGHAFNDTDASIVSEVGSLATSYDDTEGVFGYVLEAYARYKVTSNFDLGILGTYKDFASFDVNSQATGHHETGPFFHNTTVNDKTSVDADEWAVKATATWTFN